MTEQDISALLALAEEAEERAEKATPGPWGATAWDGGYCEITSDVDPLLIADCWNTTDQADANVEFILAARNTFPPLARAVKALAEELKRLRDALTEIADNPVAGGSERRRMARAVLTEDGQAL